MVAVLEVPDSPTRSTGLFIFTICSRIQLALVVSIVGTKANDDWMINKIHVENGTQESQKVKINIIAGHLIRHCLTGHRIDLYLKYQQTSSQGCGYIW